MFRYTTSKKECKELYRKLSLKLHPDVGGSTDLMLLLNKSFEDAMDNLSEAEEEIPSTHPKQHEDIEEIFEFFSAIEENLSPGNFKFINSLHIFYKSNGFLTEKQHDILYKIYLTEKSKE